MASRSLRRRRLARRGALASAFVLSVVAAAAACSLGLDESKIGAGAGDGAAEATLDAPNVLPDGGPAGAYTPCQKNEDCPAHNACTTPRCDLGRKVCVYDLCPAPGTSCGAIACDYGALTCQGQTPTAYGFHSAVIKLPSGNVGCGGVAARCFAASFPFLFVGTATSGVVAMPVADPTLTTPPPVAIAGLDFAPALIVASGPRVWFLGSKVASGSSFKEPVAWIDVPTDPTVKSLTATSVLVSTTSANIAGVLPADNGGIIVTLEGSDAPSTRLDAPLAADTVLSFFPLGGLPANAVLVASSGPRLVTFRASTQNPATNKMEMSLETAAGTVSSQNLGEVDLVPGFGAAYAPATFTQTANGVVGVSALATDVDDGGNATGVRAVRAAWAVDNAGAPKPAVTQKVDVATFDPKDAPGLGVLGPIAAVDDQRIMVLAGVPVDGGTNTSVQIATRATPAPSVEVGRFVLGLDPSRYVVAGSNGFGYVFLVENDKAGDPIPTIHVFAAGCK